MKDETKQINSDNQKKAQNLEKLIHREKEESEETITMWECP
jgi:hypothetical protein